MRTLKGEGGAWPVKPREGLGGWKEDGKKESRKEDIEHYGV